MTVGDRKIIVHKSPSKEYLMYEASLRSSPTQTYMPTQYKEK